MLPSREEAERMIAFSEKMNPGKWGDHSRVTAECAEKIAVECSTMEPDKAYIVGLLHDIGRRFGKSQFGHIVDGYNYMVDLGYDDVAKICLTHSFPIKDISTYIGNYDVPDHIVKAMDIKLSAMEYDDYDRLIQLSDCLAMPEGIVNISERMADVARRYGYYSDAKREANYRLKEYFEKKMNRNIYEVITDRQELWGL